jgi:hypothetical protein
LPDRVISKRGTASRSRTPGATRAPSVPNPRLVQVVGHTFAGRDHCDRVLGVRKTVAYLGQASVGTTVGDFVSGRGHEKSLLR